MLNIVNGEIKNYFTQFRLGNTNCLLKQADGSILIEMKGIVLCEI